MTRSPLYRRALLESALAEESALRAARADASPHEATNHQPGAGGAHSDDEDYDSSNFHQHSGKFADTR